MNDCVIVTPMIRLYNLERLYQNIQECITIPWLWLVIVDLENPFIPELRMWQKAEPNLHIAFYRGGTRWRASYARNFGIEYGTSAATWIIHHDDDCLFLPEVSGPLESEDNHVAWQTLDFERRIANDPRNNPYGADTNAFAVRRYLAKQVKWPPKMDSDVIVYQELKKLCEPTFIDYPCVLWNVLL